MSEHAMPRLAPRRPAADLVLPVALLGAAAIFVWLAPLGLRLQGFLAFATLALCLGGMIYAVRSGMRPIALIYFVFVFGWLGVAQVHQLATGRLAWMDGVGRHPPDRVTYALLMTVVAVACFFGGHALAFGSSRPRAPRRPRVSGRYLALFVVVALGGAVLVVRALGGVAVLFSSRGERWEAMSVVAGDAGGLTLADALTGVLPAAAATAFALLTISWLRANHTRGLVRLREIGVAATALVLLTLFANPLTTSRFIAVGAWGAAALAFARPRSARAGWLLAAVGLLGVLIVYPYASLLGSRADSTEQLPVGLEALVGPDFDGFQQIMNALAYVQAHGHSGGRYLVSSFAYVVPRSMWSEKAVPASIDIASDAGYWFTNLSLPVHAEFYVEFGWLGMGVAVFVLGWVCGRLDYAWHSGTAGVGTVIAPFVALAMLGIVRGPMGSLLPIYATALLLMLLGLRPDRSGERNRRRVAADRQRHEPGT